MVMMATMVIVMMMMMATMVMVMTSSGTSWRWTIKKGSKSAGKDQLWPKFSRYDDYGDDDDGVDIVRDYLGVTNMSFKLYII